MHEVQIVEPKFEKDGLERLEAAHTGRPAEIEGRTRAELEGDWRGLEIDRQEGEKVGG